MDSVITIYTTNTCAYCVMVKRYLDMKKKKYAVINLDDEPDRRQEAYDLSGGATTVPITVIKRGDDQKVVIGWKAEQLAAAIA